MIIALIMSAALSATSPPAKAPDLYGITIGQPLPFAECGEYRNAKGKLRKRDKYWRWIYGGPLTPNTPCFQRGREEGSGSPLGSFEHLTVHYPEPLRLGFASMIRLMVNDGRVVSIEAETNGENSQAADLETLTEKYGVPTKLDNEATQNGFGAKFVRVNATWDFGSGVLGRFFGFGSKRTEGSFELSTTEAREQTKREIDKIIKIGRRL